MGEGIVIHGALTLMRASLPILSLVACLIFLLIVSQCS